MKKIIVLALLLVLASSYASALTVSIRNQDPLPANVDEFVNVWFEVEQSSGEETGFEDVVLTIDPRDGLELAAGEEATRDLGSISGFQVVRTRFKVTDNALDGENLVKVEVRDSKSVISKNLFVEVTNDVPDLRIGDIESSPVRMKPGDDDVRIDVTLVNIGEADAQTVTTELRDLPNGITLSQSYSGTALLGNIEEDESETATLYVDVDEDVEAKEHLATLVTTYKTTATSDVKQIRIPIRLAVHPIPLYEVVDVSFNKEELRAGDKSVAMTLTIKNIGKEEGESVRVRAYGKSEQPFTFDVTSDFASPKLLPGETAQATIEFDIEDDANIQDYTLDIEIKNVAGNDVLISRKSVPVRVSLPKANNPFPLVLVGLIALGVAGGIYGVRYMRKKRKPVRAQKVKGKYGKSHL